MEKDKSRGLKHINNKHKYKNNSTNRNIPSKARPDLKTNWDRYDVKDDEEQALTKSQDFSVLANVPIGRDQHFQFRSEKLLAQEITNESSNKLFSLDLKKLEENILTVPFFERVGIKEDTFSKQQIEIMKSEANEFHKRLMEKNKHSILEATSLSKDISSKLVIDNSKNDEIDSDKKILKKEKLSEDDLEDWLDSILKE